MILRRVIINENSLNWNRTAFNKKLVDFYSCIISKYLFKSWSKLVIYLMTFDYLFSSKLYITEKLKNNILFFSFSFFLDHTIYLTCIWSQACTDGICIWCSSPQIGVFSLFVFSPFLVNVFSFSQCTKQQIVDLCLDGRMCPRLNLAIRSIWQAR